MRARPVPYPLIIAMSFLALLSMLAGCGKSGNSGRFLKSEERLQGMYEACLSIEISDPARPHPVMDTEGLRRLPRVDVETVLKRSNGMQYPGTWSGPALSVALSGQGVEGDFRELRVVAWDGYVAHLSRDIAMRPDTILAYEQDGAELPHEDGPVRLVVGSEDGFYWIRMITRIEIVR